MVVYIIVSAMHGPTNNKILRVIKSRALRWSEYVAGMGKMRNLYNIVIRETYGSVSVGVRIILK